MDSSKKGKYIEYFIISELLKHDFNVYTPVVDNGTDMIVKDDKGGLVEIQVKSRSIRHGRDCFIIKDFEPRFNFFIVCHNLNEDVFYVIPSLLFHKSSKLDMIEKRRKLSYFEITKYNYYKNEKGIELLKKALTCDENKINLFLEEEKNKKN